MTNELTTRPAGQLARADLERTLTDFLRLNVADGDASQKTIDSYVGNALQHFTWLSEHQLSPWQATEEDLKHYRAWLVGKYAKVGTVAVKLAAVRRLYDMAQARAFRPDNPAKGIRAPRDKTAREDKVKFLPLEGFKRLLSLPNSTRDRAIIALMGWHGLRVDEIVRLDLGDVAADLSHLNVTGKGDKARVVHLVDRSAAALADWLEVRPGLASSQEPAVFVAMSNRTTGHRLTTRAVRHMVDGYLKQAGLKAQGLSCHSLRHSFATWSLSGGAKLSAISAAMGHSSVETTQVYARIVDKIQENPAKYLAAVLGE